MTRVDPALIAAAQAALARPFDPTAPGTELVAERSPAKVVFSTRVPPEYGDPIAAEAKRCRQTPSQLIADLIGEALTARAALPPDRAVVMVNLAELHRAIDAAAHRLAA